MLNRTASLLAAALFVLVAVAASGCHAHRLPRPSDDDDDDTYRRMLLDDSASRVESEIFGTRSDDSSSSRDESSISLDEAPVKRRKGPTLSVVNPLEILRQRLMLDLARRKIHENQQQIVANAHFLENIGKRSH